MTHVNFHFILLKMRERVFPSISFLSVSVKVKKALSLYSGVLKRAFEHPLTRWDKIGTFVRRKYSATCLVKYYDDFFVGFVFCTKEQCQPKYFNAQFLPLSKSYVYIVPPSGNYYWPSQRKSSIAFSFVLCSLLLNY